MTFLLIGSQMLNVWPHETVVHYRLGADHGQITDARIAYLVGGEEAAGANFRWAEGAPHTVRHVVDLHPGHYTIAAELRGGSLRRDVSRSLEVPTEGTVTVDLSGAP
ncbi:MAG: hypothetical protein JRH11_18615 [Deltaproteobacteria bacterium]|nr:hypothetical protein [Deltaproteobacteria bacterium]